MEQNKETEAVEGYIIRYTLEGFMRYEPIVNIINSLKDSGHIPDDMGAPEFVEKYLMLDLSELEGTWTGEQKALLATSNNPILRELVK